MGLFRRARTKCPKCQADVSRDVTGSQREVKATCARCKKELTLPVQPFWWLSYRDPGTGRQCRRKTMISKKQIAESRLRILLNEIHDPDHKPICTLTLRQACDEYVADRVPLLKNEASQRRTINILNRVCNALDSMWRGEKPADLKRGKRPGWKKRLTGPKPVPKASRPLVSVDGPALDKFHAWAAGKGHKPGGILRVLATLQAVMSYAVTRGWLTEKPALPKIRPGEGRRVYLTAAEVELLADAIGKRDEVYRDLVLFLAASGCRRGEALAMEWTWLHLDDGRIDLPGVACKSGRGRSLPVTPALAAVFERRKAAAEPGCGHVFHQNGKAVDPGKLLYHYTRAVTEAGLDRPGGVHIHDLRHSTASLLLAQGVGLAVIQQVLGHSQIQMTMRYSHLMQGALAEGLSKVTVGLPSPPPQDGASKGREGAGEAGGQEAADQGGAGVASPGQQTRPSQPTKVIPIRKVAG